MTALRPNYRLARELKAEIDEVRIAIEEAEKAGNFSQAQDLKESLHDMEHAMWMTGVGSEYDL